MAVLQKDPTLSPSKQVKSKQKIHHHQHQHQHHQAARLPNISRQSSCNNSITSFIHQKFAPSPHVQSLEMVQLAALAAAGGGVFFNNHLPPQFSHSSSLPPILPTHYQHHYYHHQQQRPHQQQPPLLPLPVASKPITFRSLPPPALSRSHSLASPIPRKPPSKIKSAKTTAAAKTVKKKPAENIKKENRQFSAEEESSKETEEKKAIISDDFDDDDDDQIVWPAKGAGPDPGSLPKEFMTRVLLAADLNKKEVANNNNNPESENKFNNLISPPPSSLPLPKFTMRRNNHNLSCNAQAAAAEVVDNGPATDNLRRLLKLR